MLSTLGAQRIAANQATRLALLPSLGNPHVTEDSDSPQTGNFPPAAPEVPSLCPAGLQGPVSSARSSREEKQMLFWGIQTPKMRRLLTSEPFSSRQATSTNNPRAEEPGCFAQGRHPAAPTSRRNCSQKPGTVTRAADRLYRSCPSVENGAGGR